MQTDTLTEQLFKRYEFLYDYFNTRLFDDTLPPVLLNLSRRDKAYGFYVRKNWGNVNFDISEGSSQRTISEISLNPSFTGNRSAKEYISTLVHEMVHHWQYEFGKPGRWGYHNKQFADKMESIGLEAFDVKTGKRTGRHVSHRIIPGGKYERNFDELPDELKFPIECYELLGATRDEIELKIKRQRARKSKTKYICSSGCDQILWGKPALIVKCGICGASFKEISFEDEILHPDQLNPDLE